MLKQTQAQAKTDRNSQGGLQHDIESQRQANSHSCTKDSLRINPSVFRDTTSSTTSLQNSSNTATSNINANKQHSYHLHPQILSSITTDMTFDDLSCLNPWASI